MSQQWYYGVGGKQHGPVSAEQLKQLANSGQLQPTALVWKEGMAEWAKASAVKGLFPQGNDPPPLPAGMPPLPPAEPPSTALPATTTGGGTEAAVADLVGRGISRSVAAPPVWRLAWKLGLEAPPPHFMTFGSLALWSGALFAVLWGASEYLLGWGHEGAAFVAISSVTAGAAFGCGLAAYYRYSARSLSLPSLDHYSPSSRPQLAASERPIEPVAGSAPSLWNPSAAGLWSLLFTWAFGSFLLARNRTAFGEPAKAKRSMLWFYGFFAWIPLYGLIHYWTTPDPHSNEFSAVPHLVRLAAYLVPYFLWALLEVNPQTKLVKSRFQDQYARNAWGVPIATAVTCQVVAYVGLSFLGGSEASNLAATQPRASSAPSVSGASVTGWANGRSASADIAELDSASSSAGHAPPGSRELGVSVNSAGIEKMPWWIRKYNASLKSVTCYAKEDQLVIDFDVDKSQWIEAIWITPLLVRLFDRNGEYLTHFVTTEKFTVFPAAHDHWREVNTRFVMGGLPDEAKKYMSQLLEPTGNRLVYTVNVRDLRDAASVEIGFYEIR